MEQKRSLNTIAGTVDESFSRKRHEPAAWKCSSLPLRHSRRRPPEAETADETEIDKDPLRCRPAIRQGPRPSPGHSPPTGPAHRGISVGHAPKSRGTDTRPLAGTWETTGVNALFEHKRFQLSGCPRCHKLSACRSRTTLNGTLCWSPSRAGIRRIT